MLNVPKQDQLSNDAQLSLLNEMDAEQERDLWKIIDEMHNHMDKDKTTETKKKKTVEDLFSEKSNDYD